jgi:hypothetical protein
LCPFSISLVTEVGFGKIRWFKSSRCRIYCVAFIGYYQVGRVE